MLWAVQVDARGAARAVFRVHQGNVPSDSTPSPSGERVWSDACALEDLARLDREHTAHAAHLDLDDRWPVRWTTTWKYGRSASVTCPVQDLNTVDLSQTVPVRRFTWRTDQEHRPGLEYMTATDRHHGFESFEEECLLLVADFAADLTEALCQPFRLCFYADGGRVDHTPDYLLLTRRGPIVVDVRPAGRIHARDNLKFAATAEAALSAGWRFAVLTGWRAHVRGAVDAMSAERRPLDDVLGIQGQLHQVAAQGPMPYGELVDRCSLPAVARAHALHLLWRRQLGVDLSGPYGDERLVRLAPRKLTRGQQ
ncbi:TnsA-like heteromeric transposase endonuclease subunit [Streptomyces sp. NPDC057909]|uniref:TnsA-like heteromeric transposase endonuclease subunit n=1 Tax=Streptomyces sp. NPDC057909 TaxID=3346277 RepID=UPI0036E69E62